MAGNNTPTPKADAVKDEGAVDVEARVLVDGPHGKINDIVVVSKETADTDPTLDPHPSAVRYAKAAADRAAAAAGEALS